MSKRKESALQSESSQMDKHVHCRLCGRAWDATEAKMYPEYDGDDLERIAFECPKGEVCFSDLLWWKADDEVPS